MKQIIITENKVILSKILGGSSSIDDIGLNDNRNFSNMNLYLNKFFIRR